jgi:hypothetical protein
MLINVTTTSNAIIDNASINQTPGLRRLTETPDDSTGLYVNEENGLFISEPCSQIGFVLH